jgi:hypothetical protein
MELSEYIGVYVDDLAIVAKDPQEIVNVLEQKYKFKLKGMGPISFHLGFVSFVMRKESFASVPNVTLTG